MRRPQHTPGVFVLKSKLQDITKAAETSKCPMGALIDTLDRETQDALKSALASSASTRSIHKALRDEKYSIDRMSVQNARQCFQQSAAQCKCGHGGTQ